MTPRQKQVLDAIRILTVDGVSPTFDQIRNHVGLTSKGEVHRIVTALERSGYLTRHAFCRRAITLTTPDPIEAMTRDALLSLRALIDRRLAA